MIDEAAPSPQTVLAIVTAFAAALDAGDLAVAGTRLGDDCELDTGAERIRGRAAILAFYGDASAWARGALDDVRYESEVEGSIGITATVRFTKYLVKAGGHFHRHRCRQEFTVGPDHVIVRIAQLEIAGEKEALAGFFRKCGIER